MKQLYVTLFPYIIGCCGGIVFNALNIPLPWILGPMIFLITLRSIRSKQPKYVQPLLFKNISLSILGISFGLSFNKDTFLTVAPYVVPFLIATIVLISFSIINGVMISKFVKIDRNTSIFASIPGGLTEMVTVSESLNANTSLVTIFQTVRLLTVVFFVPFTILHMFEPQQGGTLIDTITNNASFFSFGWYILAGLTGYLFKSFLPASYVIGPLLTTAMLNIIGISLPSFSNIVLVFAQLTIGISFGLMITFKDLKIGGKYCGLYFLTTLLLIGASFGIGYLFTLITDLDTGTAMLSFAPGGLVEMVLTASSIGADPAVVSSLQFIRLLFIISVLPSLLKFGLKKITYERI